MAQTNAQRVHAGAAGPPCEHGTGFEYDVSDKGEQMDLGRSLAAAALIGILAGCAAQKATDTKVPSASAPDPNTLGKNGCGNHDGGSCGAMETPQPPKAP